MIEYEKSILEDESVKEIKDNVCWGVYVIEMYVIN